MGASILSGCGHQQEETFEGPYEPDLVTIFCAYGAGTGVDMQGRQTFNIMKREGITDANFLFENFPGASGQVGFAVATQQRAGDYNLIFVLSSTMAMLNEIQGGEYSYKDMIPIGQVADDFNAVVVPGSSPVDTLEELIEASQEEELVGGCSGAAGIGDILINRLKKMCIRDSYRSGPGGHCRRREGGEGPHQQAAHEGGCRSDGHGLPA